MAIKITDVTEINDTAGLNGTFKVSGKPSGQETPGLIRFRHNDENITETYIDMDLTHEEANAIINAFQKVMTAQEQEYATNKQKTNIKCTVESM